MNLPNKLTLLRIFLIPVFVAVFYLTVIPYNLIISAGVFALAAFTDFLDGYIARKHNLVTDLGKFLDPIADKVLVSTALIVILIPTQGFNILPANAWYVAVMVAIIMARELIVSAFRLIAASKGKVIAADKSGKLKTFFTDLAIIEILIAGQFSVACFGLANLVGIILLGISTLLTIYSGVECFIKNKGVISNG